MKAVVLEETRKISVREVPDAEMQDTTDVLLRITSTAICGTDLHFYEGRMRGIEGGVIGHEPLGLVEEVGSTVKNVKKGDRVVVPTHICCGLRDVRGRPPSACLTTNPGLGRAYGYPNKGGTQAPRRSRSACCSLMPTASSPRRARRQLGRRSSCRRRLHHRPPRRCHHRMPPATRRSRRSSVGLLAAPAAFAERHASTSSTHRRTPR